MANDEQVKILKEKGVAAWKEWRRQNPETRPDLRGADLSWAAANVVASTIKM